MKKILTFTDLLFGIFLLILSIFAIMRGGRGLNAWPVVPFGLILISLACVQLKTRKGFHFGSAACYALVIVACLVGIFEDYSYAGSLEIERFADVLLLALTSVVLFGLHIRLWLKNK
jgi:hypothetical protein